MPALIGSLPLPRVSPHLLQLRLAVRPFLKPHVFIGLSGGADSLALVAAARAEGAHVTAICIDHNLQPNSLQVSAQAAAQAESMGASAIVRTIDVPKGEGMEAAARDARYAAFTELSASIWVAHTMDDQAETYLLAGLRGNPAAMTNISTRADLTIIRPLLSVRRADTQGTCAELGIQPWIDPHNHNHAYRRVSIRERVLPLLNEIHQGDAVPGLALAARRASEDAAVLDGIVDKRSEEWDDGFPVSLAGEPTALRHRMLAHFLRGQGVAINSRILTAVDRLLTHWHGQGGVAVGKSTNGRLEVVRLSGKLRITG